MRAPLSWLAEYVDLAPGATGTDIAASLVSVGLEEEDLLGGDIAGPLVVGRVLSFEEEVQKNGKPIRFCGVDVGANGQFVTEGRHQEIVCGATNFEVGDLVVVVLPGAVLPGGFEISARRTYGRVSNGMICAEDELGIGHDHSGVIVLDRMLSAEELADVKPGDDAIALLGLDEEVVEVNVTPDRGYCFSLRGLAREYWHSQGSPPDRFRDPVLVEVPEANDDGYPVRLADDAPIDGVLGCDRYVGRMVRGIDPTRPSPSWMQRRLSQMGMRPISLAVDVTNYLMLAAGQPLHAFDLATLSGEIVVRRARPGERLTTLDDQERALDPEDLMITEVTPDGRDHLLALAGLMGGASSEVSATTTDVLVEAAHFDPITVARSSRRHRLVTEGSKRWERGVDPRMQAQVAQLAVDLLVAHGGGTPDPGVTDVDLTVPREGYLLDLTEPARLVGVDYSEARVVEILRDLGCRVERSEREHALVTAPTWRPDLVDGPDYAEEVARIDGYERIPSVVSTPPAGRGLTHGQRVRRIVAAAMAGRGFVEALTYPFVSEGLADVFGLEADDLRRYAVRVANPLSDEAPLMRTSVLATLLEALRRNVSRGRKDVGLFEIGLVTLPGAGATHTAPVPGIERRPDDETIAAMYAAVPPQPRHLAAVLTGEAERSGWWGAGRPTTWEDAVETVRTVGRALALDVDVEPENAYAPWHPGRCARMSVDEHLLGYAGELHPAVLSALGLPARTVALEVDLDVLTDLSEAPVRYRPISTYPAALTDVALVVAKTVPAGLVERALRSGAGECLEEVLLFDVYSGEQAGEGRTSLAYRLTFRAPDRTLTTEEVNEFRDAAVRSAAEAVGAVQRR